MSRISTNTRTGLEIGHILQCDPPMGDYQMKSAQPTRRDIFVNLGLFQFLSFVRRGVFYTFMISYLFDLMHTVTYTALLGTLNMVGSALGQNFLWGRIADRYNIRTKLIIAGESIAAIAYFIVFQVHRSLLGGQTNFQAGLSLIVGLSILEFFWSMSDVGWAALLTEVTTTKNRASAIGTLNFIASLGRMIGINFAGYLYDNGEGFRQGTIFYIVITMLLVGVTLMWITSRSTSRPNKKNEDRNAESPTDKGSIGYDKKTYKWFLISLIVIVIGTSCVSQVFLLFIQLPGGLMATDPEMSLILTAFAVGGMLMSLTCGWLADKFGKGLILFAGLILAILTPLAYGMASTVQIMALFYGLNGASFWIILTVGFAFAGDIIPEDRRGRLFSRYNTVIALSWGPAGLLVGGPLADAQVKVLLLSAYTAYVNVFYVSSIIVALGTAIFGFKVLKQNITESNH
jgi:MFS family permease